MTINLNVKSRNAIGKKVFSLRRHNTIPGVLYGHGLANKNVEADYVQFEKIYQTAGGNTIIEVIIDGAAVKALVQDVQNDPLTGKITHFDLRQIRMDEKITTNVDLKFIGESKAVKEEGGVLVHTINQLEIKCLPADLIHEIDVDISGLNTFDDVVKIQDINLPASIEIIGHKLEDVVAMVSRVKIEEEAPVTPVEAVAGEAATGGTGEAEKSKAGTAPTAQ